MIQEKTVFIVGAGASMHAGFPSGKELVDLLLNSEPQDPESYHSKIHSLNTKLSFPPKKELDDDAKVELYNYLNELNYDENSIRDFLFYLKISQLNSVDSFLERRPEYMPIGKIFISYTINYFEKKEVLYENPDWYRYIWNKLNAGFEEFDKNKVSFITFNYDKSLEYYLLNALIGISGKSIHECWNKLQKIPLIHLHGQVGHLTKEKPEFDFDYGYPFPSSFILDSSSQSIKIIHEKVENDTEFLETHKMINQADKIVFLGFGYNQINIDRLKLMNIPSGKIIGSTIGLTGMEIEEIRSKNPNFQLLSPDCESCEEFLRKNIILR